MRVFITQGAEGRGNTNKKSKATKSNSRGREEGASLALVDWNSFSVAMMMMMFITRGGEGRGDTSKESKATKSKGRGLEEGANRALMRQVGEEGCSGRGPN